MAKPSKLSIEIATAEGFGYRLYSVGSGKIAPETKNSNLYKAIQKAKNAGYKEVVFVVGARLKGLEKGQEFAIMVK